MRLLPRPPLGVDRAPDACGDARSLTKVERLGGSKGAGLASCAMTIAGSTEELLWNVSYQAVLETMLTRRHVVERHSNLSVKPATEHEETTTRQNVGVLAVQHTRTLEGGLARNGRQVVVPGGADLEVAIEVRPGRWLDLLLQAKALKPSGTYPGWSPQQNQKLIAWATGHHRVPGMMLYNDLTPPFVAQAPPAAIGDFACAAFGACPSVNRAQLGMWRSSSFCVGPARTPAGIGLCLDQALMLAKPASPAVIHDCHFQLEHLLHTGEHGLAIDAAGTTLNALVQPTRPAWATRLLESRVAQGRDALDVDRAAGDDQPMEAAARMSAVIPFVGGDA